MGPTLLLFLALVAGTQAGPIQTELSIEAQCSRECTVSNKFNYEPGTTYEFQYDNEIRTAVQGASEDHAGLHMTAKVQLDFITKCEVVMRISDVHMKEHDPDTSTMKVTDSALATLLERNPVRVSYQDGHIEHMCLSAEEAPEIVNIKRGMLSVFQNSMDDITKGQIVSESDVTGKCETEYKSEEKGWYNQQIKKSKNLFGCSERNGYNSAIQGIPYSSQSKVQSLPLLKSTHDCEQEVVRASGRLVSAVCQEKHTFAPFSRHASGATTHNTQRLAFVSEYKTTTSPVPASTRVPLQFDHGYYAEMQTITRTDLESKLMEVCETTKNGVRPETPRLFTSLVNTMKKMEASDMAAVYEQIKSKAVCAENNKMVKKFFLDAIPMTGTSSGLKMMTSLLTSQEVFGVEADMWLTTLSFIQHPTVSMLVQVKPLLSLTKNVEKAMLSVSSLVNNLCKTTPRCNNIPEVRKILNILDSKVATCKITENNFETTLIALRAISNTGSAAISLVNRLTLTNCIKLATNPIEIRLSAIEALGMASCKVDTTELKNVYTNTEEDSEVRIAAYKALMKCPSTDILRKVKVTLGKEEVNQVGSYVWSHLTNLMKTSDPHKQAIRSILDDSILQKEFNMDKRKFSRNYEGSMFIEKINAGAAVEADLIWSSKSFIPRSAMANLTVDLFGNAVNLFEIGGRVEGLEYFLEAYFGPNGHFSENDVQAAVDETALQIVKADKVNRINKRMNSAMDDLRGSLYMKVFGNELRYMNFQGLDSLLAQNSINFLDILMKLKDGNDYQFTQSAIFLDSSIIVPTSSGFPLNLTLNGTATVDLKASGKMDVLKLTSSPPTLDVQGEIRPSGAVVISSMMSVDAFVTKVGIKMVSSLHSNTALKGRMSLADGHIFNLELDAPEEKMDVFSVQSSFFTVHRDMEREQRMITENRQEMKACTGGQFAKITGLELCGEVQFPNASLVENAPYFPMTGPVNVGISLNKKDSLTSYKLEARSTHTKKQNVVRLAFSTPNGQVDRSFGINFDLNKVDGTFDTSLTSPWRKADFKGAVIKSRNEMGVNGKLNLDNSLRYEVKAHVKSAKSGPGMAYTPTLIVRSPGMTPVELTGTVKYAAWKLLDIDTAVEGITRAPVTFKTTILNKSKLMRFSTSIASGNKSPYTFDASIQKTQLKTKVTYKPQISIRTPTAEVFAFGGSVAYAPDQNVIVQGKLDKVFSKPVSFKCVLKQSAYRRDRVRYYAALDFRSLVADIKLKAKLDNRNMKTITTDVDMSYVIRKYARDNIKFVSKIVSLSSKTLTKGKTSMLLVSKKHPEINFKLTGNVNHNKKYSEIDADFVYGANPKDADKQISLSVSMSRKLKSWSMASAAFKGEFVIGKNLRMVSKINHSHTKKSLDSSVMLRLNKQAVSSSLMLNDKSAALMNVAGNFELSYPGKSLSLTQTVIENKSNDFTSMFNAQIGKAKHTIVVSWKKESPASLTISSDVILSGFDPVRVEGMYTLDTNIYKASGLFSKGASTYRIASTSTINIGKQVDISSEIEYPSRHIIANFEGTKTGDRFTGRTDIRWNADRDDTQRITVLGDGQVLGADNIDGSFTLQYPSRTISGNLKHTAKSKFNTHVDFKWAQNKQISMDSSFGKYDKRDSSVMSGSLKLKTPFQNLKSLDVSVENEMVDAEYKTKVNIEWNPKNIISAIATLKRPFTLQSIDVELVAKTPFKYVKNIKALLRHKIKQGIKTVGKFGVNKKSAQFDLTLINNSGNRRTNMKGQLDIKSTFKALKVASIALSHNNNGKEFQSNINFQHNKNKYSVQNSLRHVVNGWNANNNGEFTINSPSETIVTKWDHSNTLSEMTSSVETTWGKSKRVYLKYSGRQDLAWATGSLSSALEVQTPFKRIRDVVFQINHEHRPSQIDSSLTIMNEGTQSYFVEGKYLMEDGQFTSSLVLNGITAEAEVVYKAYPLSGHLEVTVAPKITVIVDVTYSKDNNGNIDGTLTIPNTESIYINPVTFSVQRIAKQGGFDSIAKLQYNNNLVASLESSYRLDKNKMISLKFVSLYTHDYSAAISIDGTAEHFDARASIEALPLVPKLSATASFDSRTDLNGVFRVNTPFRNVPYSQVAFNSYASDGARKSSLTIEYVPGKQIEASSVYKLYRASDIELSLTIKTPSTQMPYAAFVITHQGDLRQSISHAELEYAMGKKVTVDALFAMENGIDGSLNINTPFSKEVKGAFSHKGVSSDFQTHGDITWGTTHSLDIKHEVTLHQFKSSFEVSKDNIPYTGMINLVRQPTLITEVSFESPINGWETVKFAHSLSGNLAVFTNLAELHISKYGKFGTIIDIDTVNTKSVSVVVKTPYKKYSNMRAVLSHDGEMRRFQTNAEFQNDNDKIVANIRFKVEPSMNVELMLETPFTAYRSSKLAFKFNGKSNDFKVHTEAHLSQAIHKADLIFDYNKKLSIDMTITSPLTNTVKVSVDHWGSWKKFTSRFTFKAGKAKASSEVRFQIKPSFKASVSIKSPFKMLQNQQFTLKHAGTVKSFKCNMQYKCNGKVYIGNMAFQNLNAMKAEMNLKGPEFKPIKAVITQEGYITNFQSSADMSMGKKKIQAYANLNTLNGLKGTVAFDSSIQGFKSVRAAVTHSGTVDNFRCHGEAVFNKQRGEIVIEFDSTNDMSASVTMATPFKGYEAMSASLKHTGTVKNFNTLVQYVQKSKSVEGQVQFDFGKTVSGSAAVRSQFKAIKNIEISFNHEGSTDKLETHGELIFDGQRSDISVLYDSTNGYTGSFRLTSPLIPSLDGVFRHSNDDSHCNTNVQLVIARDTYSINLDKTPLGANLKVKTPIKRYESTEAIVHFDGSKQDFVSKAELFFNGNTHLIKLNSVSSSDIHTQLYISSPLMRDIVLTFEFTGPLSNFKTAFEYNLAGDSQLNTELSLQTDGHVSGEFKLTSIHMKDITAQFSHEGQLNDFSTTARLMYEGRKQVEGTLSFIFNTNIEGAMRFTAPFCGDVEVTFAHNGPLTNCRTTGNVIYDGESQIAFNSNFRLQPTIDGELIVRTAIPEYRKFILKGNHAGESLDFKSHLKAILGDHSITGDIAFSPRQSRLSLRAPMIEDIDGHYTIEGKILNFESEAQMSYGSTQLLDATVHATYPTSAEFVLNLPVSGYRKTRMAITNDLNEDEITSHAEIEVNGYIHQVDVSVNNNNARLSLKSPMITPTMFRINYPHTSGLYQYSGEFDYGDGTHVVEVIFGNDNKIQGSITVKSPLMSDISGSFETTTNINSLQMHGKITYGRTTLFNADLSTDFIRQKFVSINIEIPNNIAKASVSLNGNAYDFKAHGEAFINRQLGEVDVSFYMTNGVEGSLTIGSPFTPLMILSINHKRDDKSFTSHAEIQMDSDKHETDISLNLNGKIDGSLSIKSPMINPMSGKFVYENMNVQTEIVINNDIHKLDAILSMDQTIRYSIRVQSPLCKRVDITFQTNTNIRRLRSELGLSYGNIEQVGIEMSSDFTKSMSGAFNARIPNNAVTGLFTAEGDMTAFNGHFESTWNDRNMEFDTSFALTDNVRGLIKLSYPSNSFELSFLHSGNYRNFESNGKFTFNDNESEIVMMLNTETAMKGSVRTSSPLLKPVVATFDHTGSKTVVSLDFDQVKQFQAEASFSTNPMQGNIDIRSTIPGYEILSAAFNHKGHTLDFSNHVEFAINGERTETDMSFNIGSQFEGKMTASSPYFPSTSASFNFRGKPDNFRTQLSFVSKKSAYDVTASMNTRSGVDGSLTIKTPIQGYKTIVGTLSHTGTFPNVNTLAEIKTGRRNLAVARVQLSTMNGIVGEMSVQSILTPTLHVSVNHKGDVTAFTSRAGIRLNEQSTSASASFKQSSSLEGKLSLSSPYFRPLSGNFKLASGFGDFIAKIQGNAGTDSISGDITYYTNNDAGVTVIIKTPFKDFETIVGSAKYSKSYKGFSSNVNFDLTPIQKYEMNVESHWNRGMQGSIAIKTPFVNMRQSSITANYNGIFPNIQSNVAVEYDDKKYAVTGELQHAESTNGKVSIETPLVGYESIGLIFNTQGDFIDFQADAQLAYANGKEMVASVRNVMSEGKLETKAKFESPETDDLMFVLSFKGSMCDFTNSIAMSIGSENALESTTAFKLNKMTLELENTLTSTLAGYTDEQKVVMRHDGPLSDMTSSVYVKVFNREYSVGTSFKADSKIEGQFALKTPINNLKDITFNFEHRGSLRRFSTKSELQYDTDKKIKSTIQYAKSGSRRLQTSFEVSTPFGGFENTRASYRHTASVDNFECEAEMSIMENDFNGSLRAANSPISATISLKTPFRGYEQIGGDMKLNYGDAAYVTELNIAYMQGKTISVSSEMDIQSSPKTAHFKLTTPFEGYEDAEIRLSHNGDLMNFQSIASVSSTFIPSMRAHANLQSASWENMDADITFSSQIMNLKALKFTMKNAAIRGKYTNRVEASWSQDKSIVMDNVFNRNKDSTTVDISLSTPFDVARQVTIKSAGRKSGSRYVESFSTQYNGETYVDTDLTVDIGVKKYASLQINSPTDMNIELSGFSSNGRFNGNVMVNKAMSVDGSFDTKTNKAVLKYNCPKNIIISEVAFDKTHPNLDVVINNARYGYDMSTFGNGGRIKMVLPSRSFVIAGKQNDKTTEGSFMWDADADETKKVGFRTTLTPSEGATKADVTLMMPSIGKDVQIDSEMIVNRGRVLFEGKGELTYSKDMRKKFTITSRLEDISNSWSSKNYSFSLGISHPYTSVGVELSSHLANSDDKITGAFDLKYQTVARDTKSFSVNGEINKMKKSVNVDMDTPIKKISIAGNAHMETPYSVSMMNKYDGRRPLRTVLSLDPSRRSVNFQMNYDEENPNNEFHIVAKYANSSAVSAEVFHVVNRKRVTDALVSLRLNNSHLLHSRVHWRPAMVNDLKDFTNKKANSYSSRFRSSMSSVSNAIQYEAAQKARRILDSAVEELEPLMVVLVEPVESFIQMYDTNQYHVRDITDALLTSVEDVKLAYDEMAVASKEYLSQLTEQLKERASNCIDVCSKDMEIVLNEINEVMQHFSKRSNTIYQPYFEHMYNMTRHPRVIGLQQHYNDFTSLINTIPVQEHLSNMADTYTSAIYATNDVINANVASIMARNDVQYVKSVSDRIVHQGKNAYKYWEVQENAEALAEVIVDWIKSEIENEISDLKATIISIKKTSVTVYDPEHGEIQLELHLPFPLRSLDEVPEVDVVPYISQAKRYIPRIPRIYLPSLDVRTWIPPYNAWAEIVGDKVTTFDGLTYNLDGKCTFLLTKDFVDGNFSIGLNNGESRSLTISADGKNIVLLSNGQVLVDEKLITLPAVFKNITISASDEFVTVDGAGSFRVTYYKSDNAYAIELNGWYFGKVSGLLGTYDNEPSNEMMTSFGNVKNHAGRFSKSWDIGTARCR